MTLFDVIRYPISFTPTQAELEALPPGFLSKWARDPRNQGWQEIDLASVTDAENLADWFRRCWNEIEKEKLGTRRELTDLEKELLHDFALFKTLLIEWESE